MFICGDRGTARHGKEKGRKSKGERARQKERGHRGVHHVEGEIYLPAACADKIIRQKTPGVDDGKPGEGNVEEKEKGEE